MSNDLNRRLEEYYSKTKSVILEWEQKFEAYYAYWEHGLNKHDPDKQTILIADDYQRSAYMTLMELKTLESFKEEDYNILLVSSNYAPMIIRRYLECTEIKIDYMILDIEYNCKVYYSDGNTCYLDGIDILIDVLTYNPKANFLFKSASYSESEEVRFNGIIFKQIQDFIVTKDIHEEAMKKKRKKYEEMLYEEHSSVHDTKRSV